MVIVSDGYELFPNLLYRHVLRMYDTMREPLSHLLNQASKLDFRACRHDVLPQPGLSMA